MRSEERSGAVKVLRKAVRWSSAALLPGELLLILCVAGGVTVPPAARLAARLAVLTLMIAAGTLLPLDYRRHRRAGLDPRPALLGALADTIPAPVRRLTAHELFLSTSFVRWVTRRGPHGVREGDVSVPYAPGQTAVMLGFFFVCVVETVALAFLIPWPVVHAVTLVLDIWGCYFVIALHASCVVRPHVIAPDGSLRLRYGVLLDIRIPADRVASVRQDRKFPEGKLAAVDDNGVADIAVAGQTTVTVELTEPVAYIRALGTPAEARAFRFYAEDPGAAVAALRAAMVSGRA
ncbi:hypothetical protein BN159_0741 [Streptomyces davaonensis JCM 4913]|uniref:Uncharacterized protein n=1 Tax=Streptomyces davaonensis (strain DSM 101723 / JCM 4913 / KCC S-0913 / 768) TaxID=1214101 RepID=K4QWA1_STRDJ|nr:hypothetical protein [Streptomyces davaonensis]CCK25120.1 hypothetical protein BN159_0741 [Streptomyces davaonensis JCM 4913]